MNFERLAERTHRRKRIARTQLTGDHRLPGSERHLFMDRSAGLEDDLERNHQLTAF
jgi:hypothetical protein